MLHADCQAIEEKPRKALEKRFKINLKAFVESFDSETWEAMSAGGRQYLLGQLVEEVQDGVLGLCRLLRQRDVGSDVGGGPTEVACEKGLALE